MLALIEPTAITPWHWIAFVCGILIFLSVDLGVFHRQARVVRFREAAAMTALCFMLAMVFAFAFVRPKMGGDAAKLFIAGYITEWSLSLDNVFVIALIFGYFRIPNQYQHRVLFWGIVGALVMRGAMIGAGAAVISAFHWTLYLFGAFLVYTGIQMIFTEEEGVDPDKNPVIRLARKLYPVTPHFDGQKFFTGWQGRRALTPLAIVLLMVETTDLIFAVDSIPAIFGLTTDPFIVFTSNVFAILGLRSLYFVLAGAIGYFRYLKVGLALVLVFIGVKMLADPHKHERPEAEPLWFQFEIGPNVSLAVVASILIVSILLSVFAAHQEAKARSRPALAKEPPASPDAA
jgi:tellurite resistance protein TerC